MPQAPRKPLEALASGDARSAASDSRALQRQGSRYRRLVKRAGVELKHVLAARWTSSRPESGPVEWPDPERVRRVLLVRANYRIGNVVLASAMLSVLRAKYPHATIDALVGDVHAALLEGLGFGRIHTVSRDELRHPWRHLALFLRLRKLHYDLAVDAAWGSFSGTLYGWLGGARWRLGVAGRNDRFINLKLAPVNAATVYDLAPAVARQLALPDVAAWPVYRVSDAEAARADERLGASWTAAPFVAVFVGGHADKRWPEERWHELIARLGGAGVPTLVLVGPEERALLPSLDERRADSVRVVPPMPLREFAAVVARAALLVTPDSGPMHLAAALGVPVLALLNRDASRYYVPPGERAHVLVSATAEDAAGAIFALLRARPRRPLDESRRRGGDRDAVGDELTREREIGADQ